MRAVPVRDVMDVIEHYTFVGTIPSGPNDGAWIASCTNCGRLDTPPRMTRRRAEDDADGHGKLVSVDEAKAIIGKQLLDALGPDPRTPRGRQALGDT